jgi:hypothetical protein
MICQDFTGVDSHARIPGLQDGLIMKAIGWEGKLGEVDIPGRQEPAACSPGGESTNLPPA